MTTKSHKYNHWTTQLKLSPDTAFGFIYRITNKVSKKKYIGKKQYHRYTRGGKKTGTSNWKKYTGSSKDLNADIKLLGMKKFKFEIIEEYRTRGWLVYAECNHLHKCDALTQWNDEGTERVYYNAQIGAIKFIPKRFDDPTPIKRDKKT